jgi:hypothetical protein
MAQNRAKSARIRVEMEVSERQLLPGAAVQPSPQEANANARLGSRAAIRAAADGLPVRRENGRAERRGRALALALIDRLVLHAPHGSRIG